MPFEKRTVMNQKKEFVQHDCKTTRHFLVIYSVRYLWDSETSSE